MLHESSSSGFRLRSSRSWGCLLLVTLLFVLSSLYMHQTAQAPREREEDAQRIERLIAQTTMLAQEIAQREGALAQSTAAEGLISSDSSAADTHTRTQPSTHSQSIANTRPPSPLSHTHTDTHTDTLTDTLTETLTDTQTQIHTETERRYWLVVGMPTVARAHHEDYLLKSLAAIAEQLPRDRDDLLYGQVLVSVVNMQANANPATKHVVFERAKAMYAQHALRESFAFDELRADEILPDVFPHRTPQNDPGSANKPGFLVRRQTRNIVSVLRMNTHKAKYYLFLEDDMLLCPGGLLTMHYMLSKASRYHPDWLAVRASYGMNGIFMRDGDLAVFAQYLLDQQARRPPDHLVVEWFAGETKEAARHKGQRANVGFKYNLFDHLGVVSTLRAQKSGSFPRCYELLLEPTVFKVEAFSPAECPHDDVWPCKGVKAEKPLVLWNV